MNKINWTAVAVFAIVALLVFLIAGSLWGGIASKARPEPSCAFNVGGRVGG